MLRYIDCFSSRPASLLSFSTSWHPPCIIEFGMNSIQIYSDDDISEFHHELWILNGKKYPDDPSQVPPELEAHIDITTRIPLDYETALLPNEDLSASVLHGRDISHREFVKKAVQSVGQAILDGALAVLDGRYAGGRLPLWTITYWRRMDIILETKMIWKQAEDWLLYGMISTGVVDLMVHWISEKVRASDEVRGRYVVVGLEFWTELDKAHNHGYFTSSPIPRFLERLEKKLRTREKTLLFPVFLSKHKHFIVMEVDFMKAAIACGNSLHHRDSIVLTTVIRKIQWWMEVRMGGKFQWKGDTMAHGNQSDWVSCGIYTANTIAHAVLSETLWDASQTAVERAIWFNRLAEAHIASTVAPFIDSSIPQAAFTKPVTIPHDMGDLLNPSTAGDLAEVYSKVQDSKLVSDDGHMQNNEEMGYDTEDFNENQFGVDVPWPSDTEACTVSRAVSTISSDTDMMDLSATPSPKSRVEGIRAKLDSAGVYSIFAETRQRAEVAARRKADEEAKEVSKKRARSLSDGDSMEPKLALGTSDGDSSKQARAYPEHIKLDDTGNPAAVGNLRTQMKSRLVNQSVKDGTFVLDLHKYDKFQESIHAKLASAGTLSLSSYFSHQKPSASSSKKTMVERPCPGLRISHFPLVEQYLKHTRAAGGGGPSWQALTEELYPSVATFAQLPQHSKKNVYLTQRTRWRWLNHFDLKCVVAKSCLETVCVLNSVTDLHLPACVEWMALLKDKGFKVACARPIPEDQNWKFIPHVYGEADTLAVEIWGRTHDIQALIHAFKPDPRDPCILFAKGVVEGQFDNESVFVDLVKTMVLKKDKELRGVGMQGFKYAPDVLEFAHIISVHSPRAYQSIRKLLQLPDVQTLQRHRAHQGGLPIAWWKGPVGLMSDDTKLMAALRPYRDVDGKLYILGGTGEPMLLVDPDALISALRSGTIKKGTKVRVMCLQVPMPNIPTLVIAALAITDDMSADNLLPYLQSILNGLLRHQIQVISYAADGTGTERALQRKITETATSFHSYIIHHPEDYRHNIDLCIPRFRMQQQPIAMVQDPLHLRKTVRNNSYSGARLLTLGNYPVLYSHFRDIAAANNGTLYNRDVEKVDRQDDNAATSCDIIRFATRALLQLVIIYRDHLDGVYPLLPWLLSTAVCEHVFGICRQIIKDFTMQDFHHMVPKLYARASGYNHTYTDSRKIDLAALATYPTDAEIQRAAMAAYEEAHGLWEILRVEGLRNQTAIVLRLPSIRSWFINPLIGSDEIVVNTPVSDVESEVGDEDEEPGTRQGIQEAMEWLEDEVTLPHEDDQLNSLAYAAISLSVQDSMHIRGLPECQLDTYQSDAAMLGQISAGCLSLVNDLNERAHPATHQMEPASLNFKMLVELRMEHQTVQADKGVRSKGKGKEQSAGESERQALLRQYTEILHDCEERGITTGNACSTRWTRHPARGGQDGQVDGQVADAPAPGNEANAAEVAGTNANETQNRRAKIFRKHRLPAFIEAANIAPESPLLQAGNGLETASKNGSSYRFVFYSDSIWLAQVLSVYSKSAGKNGKHSWVSDSSKITAVSYIAAQLFQPVAPRQFTSIPRDNMGLKVSRFALLKPTSFLVALKAVLTPAGQNFIISAQDHQYYAALQKKLASIREAIKEINGQR
ncbi:hypothetical protein EW146_g2755 [Bondarzewia mesenterica]|uniref:THAP9-like helix-turn-helix domain-containing protein n=1 Tax=Bondarzewia mesenterica TaxID=1095465 RepID=A0A4S4LZS7_9AGAM|nr:hypothetical protein EW146_g2755 [Bondarzewia mesenterica]